MTTSAGIVSVGTAKVVQVHGCGQEVTLDMQGESNRYQVSPKLWDLVIFLAKRVQICVTISQGVVIKIEESQYCN